ncbi:MAG: GNAT family N-acetyltransferase [Pseudomonadota bacterium]
MADQLPITKIACSPEHEARIRDAVRSASEIHFGLFPGRLAKPNDAAAFLTFLSDPEIHDPIYSLPRPLTVESVRAFIEQRRSEQERGEGLLFLSFDEDNEVVAFTDFEIWPEWGAGDLGGAYRRDQQGRGGGGNGVKLAFTWMFEALLLERIVATAALDNVRTARIMDRLGFQHMGEITSQRPDGGTRQSLVWELDRAEWFERFGDPT